MKRIILMLMLGLLWGCSASVVEVIEPPMLEAESSVALVGEVIITRRTYGTSLFQRLLSSPEIVTSPDEISWETTARLIVLYDETLMAEFPPSYFGVDITLQAGMVYNINRDGQQISLLYPSIQQSLISLASDAKDELFAQEGLLLIEDYFKQSGTLILLDESSRFHIGLVREFTDRTMQIAVGQHPAPHLFETIIFIYYETPQASLLEMNPAKLPSEGYVLEFVNARSQRIIMANMNDVFMPQSIVNLMNLWGESFTTEQLLIEYDPLFDNQDFLSQRLLPEICKIPSFIQEAVSVGFPLHPLRMSTIGNVRAKVVYLDFLDYRLNESGVTLENRFLRLGDDVNKYFDAVSYGQVRMEWDIHPEPLLMPKNVAEYQLTRSADRPGFYPTLEIVFEMLELHRDAIDFTGAEVIVVMFNPNVPEHLADVSPAHPVDRGRPFVTNQGDLFNAVTIASDWPTHKWHVIVHELAHTMGLIDLYDFVATSDWNSHHRHVGGFDIMGAFRSNLEFLGWNRYLMNWVNDEQVFCMDFPKESITIPLQTIGRSVSEDDDLQMIVLPIDRYKVLVIEAKEKNPFCLTCDGLLVYTVDTRIQSGRGAVKVIPVERSIDVMKNDAMIRVGESLVAYSIEISLLSASPNGYVVELRNPMN